MAIKDNQSKKRFFHFATRAILTRLHSSKSLRLSTELCILRSGLPRIVNSIITAVCVPESISGSAMTTATYANIMQPGTCFPLMFLRKTAMRTCMTQFPIPLQLWKMFFLMRCSWNSSLQGSASLIQMQTASLNCWGTSFLIVRLQNSLAASSVPSLIR